MRNYALELLREQTDRDKQKLIGPSLIGSPCDLCVARALMGLEDEPSDYWVGGVIGTAIHALLEERGKKTFPEDMHEQKGLVIGELPGYGVIKGTADRMAVEDKTLVDYKTTMKKKVPGLKKAYDAPVPLDLEPTTAKEARFKLTTYVGQSSLYARALEDQYGLEIENIALNFIPRDASTDADVFVLLYDYEREYADLVWDRLTHIWNNLYGEGWSSDDHCYACSVR